MARLDWSKNSDALLTRALPRLRRRPLKPERMGSPLSDAVPWDSPGAKEIGFVIPERYNASEILFQNLTAGRGDRIAIAGPVEFSYAALAADAGRWGTALLALGLTRGERVLFVLDDTPAYPAAFFGAIRAGLVPVLINPLTPPDLLQFYIADSSAKVALVEAEFCDRFAAGVADAGLRTLIVVNGQSAPATSEIEIKRASSWLPEVSPHLQAADTHRNDMAFWMYSSGSTGQPKGIVHLQHDMAYTHASYGKHVLKLQPDDICLSTAKTFFSYGFGNSITFPFSVGAASVLMPGRATPHSVFAALAQYRPTVLFSVPTLYTALANAPEIAEADFSSLRFAVSAAEMLSNETWNAWKVATGVEIVDCLGATEMLNVYLSNTPERKKMGAAGMRVPGYEIVLKDENGRVVREQGEGVMWIRGHSSTPLFWNNPQKTADIIREDGWLCTGDRFKRDGDGFYFFRGRADDLVKISGQWVHPLEVQSCLAEHPSVRECAVLATQLADGLTALKAFVVLNIVSFDPERTAHVLQDYVKRKLLPFKYPRIVQFMAELPKTGTGKIDRQALLRAGSTGDVITDRKTVKRSLPGKAGAVS
jgi:benzoate-CoA ligase family protein